MVVGAERHDTIVRSLRLLGLGAATAASAESDECGRMRPEALQRALAAIDGPTIVCAQVGNVMRLVMKSGLIIAMVGVVLGLAGAFALTRLMSSLLFAVEPTDKVTFAAVSLCLLLIALAACYIPARRATKVDPLQALRYE